MLWLLVYLVYYAAGCATILPNGGNAVNLNSMPTKVLINRAYKFNFTGKEWATIYEKQGIPSPVVTNTSSALKACNTFIHMIKQKNDYIVSVGAIWNTYGYILEGITVILTDDAPADFIDDFHIWLKAYSNRVYA